jgi:hypothetical protein
LRNGWAGRRAWRAGRRNRRVADLGGHGASGGAGGEREVSGQQGVDAGGIGRAIATPGHQEHHERQVHGDCVATRNSLRSSPRSSPRPAPRFGVKLAHSDHDT